MRIFTILLSSVVLFAACSSSKKSSSKSANNYQDKIELKNYNDSVSYALGLLYADGLKNQGFDDVNNALLLEVFRQTLENKITIDSGTLIKKEDASPIVNNYFIKKREVLAQKNLVDGEAFLATNKAKKGVVTTASGLQYKIIKAGSGASPTPTSNITVYYKGMLIDGQVFDQTKAGAPASFGISGLIQGWKEGLLLMKEGAKYEFYIPSNLGYGPNGYQGSIIGPNAALVFEVELVKVN